VTLTPHPLLVPWSRKSRAIPLPFLWAVRPVQSLSACTRGALFFFTNHVIKMQQNELEETEQDQYFDCTLTRQRHVIPLLYLISILQNEKSDICMINLLKTKRRLLYLKTQSVLRSKHFSSRL